MYYHVAIARDWRACGSQLSVAQSYPSPSDISIRANPMKASIELYDYDNIYRHIYRRAVQTTPILSWSLEETSYVLCQAMDNSPLAKLPAELRSQIYDLALRKERVILRTNDWAIDIHCLSYWNGITQTCRRLREESHALLFSLHRWHVTLKVSQLENFCAFLHAVGPRALDGILSLTFTIEDILPCPGVSLRCSQTVKLLGYSNRTHQSGDSLNETKEGRPRYGAPDLQVIDFYAIRAKGVETRVFETLREIGLEVKGRGSTWYGGLGPTWYIWLP